MIHVQVELRNRPRRSFSHTEFAAQARIVQLQFHALQVHPGIRQVEPAGQGHPGESVIICGLGKFLPQLPRQPAQVERRNLQLAGCGHIIEDISELDAARGPKAQTFQGKPVEGQRLLVQVESGVRIEGHACRGAGDIRSGEHSLERHGFQDYARPPALHPGINLHRLQHFGQIGLVQRREQPRHTFAPDIQIAFHCPPAAFHVSCVQRSPGCYPGGCQRQGGHVHVTAFKVRVQRGADQETAIRQPRQLRSQRFYLGHLEQQAQVLALRVQGRGDSGSR